MTFSFPEGLAPEVYPLAWLVGTWRGPGLVAYPDIPRRAVVTEAAFTHDGGPYLSYRSTTWLLDGELDSIEEKVDVDSLVAGQVWGTESGFWRVSPTPPDDASSLTEQPTRETPVTEIEVLLADPAGHVDVYLGRVQGPRIDLGTDLIARTKLGAEIASGSRLYGLVRSELFWAWDLAAFGHELQSYASGRMQRIEAGTE